jgi:hypothetical protein
MLLGCLKKGDRSPGSATATCTLSRFLCAERRVGIVMVPIGWRLVPADGLYCHDARSAHLIAGQVYLRSALALADWDFDRRNGLARQPRPVT